MNKAELLTELEFRLGSAKAAQDALEAVTDVIIREVVKGGKVTIAGFGVFERAERAARMGRNPYAGTPVAIPAHHVPAFRPSAAFKDWVRHPGRLPRAGLGALINRGERLAIARAAQRGDVPVVELDKPATYSSRNRKRPIES